MSYIYEVVIIGKRNAILLDKFTNSYRVVLRLLTKYSKYDNNFTFFRCNHTHVYILQCHNLEVSDYE